MPSLKRKRQTRLHLTPLPSSSAASAGYNKQIRDRAAAVGYEGSRMPAKSTRVAGLERMDPPLASPKKHNASESFVDFGSENSSSDESDAPRSSLRKSSVKGSSQISQSRGGNDLVNTMGRSSKRYSRGGPKRHSLAEFSDDDEEQKGSDVRGADESSDGSDMPRSSQRRRRPKRSTPPMVHEADDDTSDDDLPVSPRKRQKGLGAETAVLVDLSSGDESAASSERLPRRHKLTEEEQQEIDDDLKDLETSADDDEPPPSSRTQRQKTERELALERLKRRRSGLSDQPEAPSSAQDSEDEEDSGQDSDELPQEHRTSAKEMFAADEDDEDFLADEGDDRLGAPDGIPLQFTRYASMKPKELFRYVIEWMVQKKLNPAFERQDEIYKLAFNKLDDEVKGLAGSKFESSAWKPSFLFALRARPQIAASKMSRDKREAAFMAKCDACNRSGHTPTYEVQFQGRAYHPETLEEVEHDSDSDSDSHDRDRDTQGRILPAESHSFFIGRFCMANAETAHALQHWRYHLYEWVVDYLEGQGHNKPEKLVQRDKWGEPKRRKYANKVLDAMAEAGEVKKLYKDFKQEVENARQAKQYQRASSP